MTFDTMKNANQKNQILIYKKMVCAIDMHRKAMKLVFLWYNTDMWNKIFFFAGSQNF